ncbi:hypothetical protein [Thermus thermamylovorans]|uniref:Uncharacterized protein n=1 Tax=Thermus thermamylovorans TaxID=2509362 RepID=A0A4Q9AZR5_9DEIN|nr:hypothetical protein [Thermus thermamylovorans]TBH17623.1 hypothetical protein ETP66_08550 [Thermus thermamylovorans]
MDPLADLVDLYEYRVEDLLAGRSPKGGKKALLRLRAQLAEARLPGPLAKRFRQADARFRALRAKPAEPPLDLTSLMPEDLSPPPQREAQPALQTMALKVWRLLTEREVRVKAKELLLGRREELRLIHAFLQNYLDYREKEGFRRDFNLSRFSPTHAIPSLSESLLDLEDPKVAEALVADFLETILNLPRDLPLPPEETRTYVRRFLNRLLDWEGAYGLPPRRDLLALRRALEEARRLGAGTPEVARLEERLRREAQEERRRELLLEEERGRFRVALEKVLALLSLLPSPQGETPWPRVPEPGRLEENLATLPLAPGRIPLGPLTLTLSQVEGTWHLGLGGEDYPLGVDSDTLVIPWEDLEVLAVREGGLLHLRLEARSGLRLYELLAEGRILALLLRPEGDYAHLRLLRALSARLKGEFSPQAFGPDLAEKYRQAPEETLQDFARKVLELALKRLGPLDPGPPLSEVGQALGLGKEAEALAEALKAYLGRRPPTRETLGGEVHLLSLSPEPASLRVGQSVLFLRLREDAAYIGQAGEVPRRLKDLLVYRLAEGSLILVREGSRVAYLVAET